MCKQTKSSLTNVADNKANRCENFVANTQASDIIGSGGSVTKAQKSCK